MVAFSFFGGEERIFSLCTAAHIVCGGADNEAQLSRKIHFLAKQASCSASVAQSETKHEVPNAKRLLLARSKVQIKVIFNNQQRT